MNIKMSVSYAEVNMFAPSMSPEEESKWRAHHIKDMLERLRFIESLSDDLPTCCGGRDGCMMFVEHIGDTCETCVRRGCTHVNNVEV